MGRPDPSAVGAILRSWTPIRKAIKRMENRKAAVIGGYGSELIEGREEVTRVVSAMLSGTDVPPAVFGALAHMMVHAFGPYDGGEPSAAEEYLICGLTLDAFMLGFWTREEMQKTENGGGRADG